MAEKKDPTFGELLLQSAREAAAIARGELQPARERRYRITARAAGVKPPPRYDADGVREIRGRLELSQQVFAEALNVSRDTVRAWEQGKRSPAGPSLRLLELAARSPSMFLRDVKPRGVERAADRIVRTKHGAFEPTRTAAGPAPKAARSGGKSKGADSKKS